MEKETDTCLLDASKLTENASIKYNLLTMH